MSAPVRIKDLFIDDPSTNTKKYNEPVEFLYVKSNKKSDAPTKKTKSSIADFVQSPSTFVLSRNNRSGLSYDITIENFDIFVGGRALIRDSSLKILNGRRYGLVGRNGTGKSTLLRHISCRELDVPSHINILHVEQEVMGDDTSIIQSVLDTDIERKALLDEEKELLKKQAGANPEALKAIDQRLSEVYTKLTDINADTAEATASKILSGLGFTPEMQLRPTKEYSGGWRMRVSLARALFCAPDLLLLDEPTNMLDVRTTVWLEKYLLTWKKTLIVVSHDRSFLNNITTDIIHLHNCSLQHYTGDYDTFTHTRNERLMVLERAKQAQEDQRKHIQSFIDRFRFNANRAALVQSRIKRLEKMEVLPDLIEDPTLAFTFPKCTPLSPPIIQFKDVSFGYSDDKLLFTDVNFSIDLDSRIALVGPNGAGKSTMINLIAGDLEPSKGVLFRHGRLRLARFSQHHVDQLDLGLSSIEVLQHAYPGRDVLEYRNWLGRYGISGDVAKQKIDTLSGGQKSRVVFAMMGMGEPQVMILDEPVNHLDIETVDVLTQALNDYNGGIVLVSHDERIISYVCDEILIVENKKVRKWKGDFEQYRAKLFAELDV